jgi:hypothetical protein
VRPRRLALSGLAVALLALTVSSCGRYGRPVRSAPEPSESVQPTSVQSGGQPDAHAPSAGKR